MNGKLQDKNLILVLSKSDFISLVSKAGVAHKQPRSLYKNLETLEKKGYLHYDHKGLQFTKKGESKFRSIEKELLPYLNIINTIKAEDVSKYAKKPQTVFRM